MTASTDDDIIQINFPSTFTSLYTGAVIPRSLTINLGDGISHSWVETVNGFTTTANLASEWQSAFQAMVSGHSAQLTPVQRLEGNAEALLENTSLNNLSLSQQNQFRQDIQREYDAIGAGQEIARQTLGLDPNALLTIQSYEELSRVIKGNSLLEELAVQGHGLNNPRTAAYNGFTKDFQNGVDNTTIFIGGGLLNNNSTAIPVFFDDNGLSHLPFGYKAVSGVTYQTNQNGDAENTLVNATTALNDSMYLRTYTSADFSQTTSNPTTDAASGSQAYIAADVAIAAALAEQQSNSSTAAADLIKQVNADGSYSVTTAAAASYRGQNYASAVLSYNGAGSIISAKMYNGSGAILAQVNSDSSYKIFTYTSGSADGVQYAWSASVTNVATKFQQIIYYNISGAPIGTKTANANGGYMLTLNGAIAQVKTVNSDGSYDVHNFLNAAGSVDMVAYASYDWAYTAANICRQTTYYNTGGAAIGVSTATANGGYTLTLNGALVQVKTVNTDGSYDIHNLNANGSVDGVVYASDDVSYSAAHVVTQTVYYDGSGVAVGAETASSNGGYILTLNGAIVQVKSVNSDGSYDVHNFLNAGGSVNGVAYASYNWTYTRANVVTQVTYYDLGGATIGTKTANANGGYTLTLNGAIAQVYAVNADKSNATWTQQSNGTGVENAFNSVGAQLFRAVDAGSGGLSLYTANETVALGAGEVSVTSGGDKFQLHGHAAEIISAASLQAEAFVFQSSAGSNSWAATLSGLTTSDQFMFAASAFGAANVTAAWSGLLASAHNANGNVSITDLSGDSVTFTGASAASLAAASQQFHFV